MNKKIPIFAMVLLILGIGGYIGYSKATGNPTPFGWGMTFVSGTEYGAGEPAQTIVKVTDNFGIGVVSDWCNVTIYYPNKTAVVTNQPMTAGGSTGSYYYDWTAPTVYGIYEQYAVCKFIC
jgi:hypothetical protein